jgi:hypothetical protein
MARPKADLGDLAVPKDIPEAPAPAAEPPPEPATEAAAPEPASAPPAGQEPKAYSHTLSLRLTAAQYRRMRRWVVTQEDLTGRRVTHQSVIETALSEFLDRNRG